MKQLATLLLLMSMAVCARTQDCPPGSWGPTPGAGQPQETPKLPSNLVPFPPECRVKNVKASNGEGCCGWASLKDLLLQGGYSAEAASLDIHRGGVSTNARGSDLSDWCDENHVGYEQSTDHDWGFVETHLPCLIFFDCANSDYGYCEEDCEGIFDRNHRSPWMRPPRGGHRIAGHVAVIAGVDSDYIYMVANRPGNYSSENYQRIDKQDISQRWFGYCLCLRKHKPEVKPPVAPVNPPAPPSPPPVAVIPEKIYEGVIIVHIVPR